MTTDHDQLAHTASITFSASTESFAGMQINGTRATRGYTLQEMQYVMAMLPGQCELIELGERTGSGRTAHVLVLRGLAAEEKDSLLQELVEKVRPYVDKQAWMQGKLKNRQARYCACIGDEASAADLEHRKGVVLAYRDLPAMSALRAKIGRFGLENTQQLLAEVNDYYDAKKCYIGFHGDSERPDVWGVVIGKSKHLHFQAFCKAEPVGERVSILLNSGDAYMGCETAFGHKWDKERARKDCVHYRHAACDPAGHPQIKSNDVIRLANQKKRQATKAKKSSVCI